MEFYRVRAHLVSVFIRISFMRSFKASGGKYKNMRKNQVNLRDRNLPYEATSKHEVNQPRRGIDQTLLTEKLVIVSPEPGYKMKLT